MAESREYLARNSKRFRVGVCRKLATVTKYLVQGVSWEQEYVDMKPKEVKHMYYCSGDLRIETFACGDSFDTNYYRASVKLDGFWQEVFMGALQYRNSKKGQLLVIHTFRYGRWLEQLCNVIYPAARAKKLAEFRSPKHRRDNRSPMVKRIDFTPIDDSAATFE